MNGNGRRALPRGVSPTPTSMARAMNMTRKEGGGGDCVEESA